MRYDPFSVILAEQFRLKNVWLEEFVFTATWNTLAASASGQQASLTIDPGIDFLLLEQNLAAYSSAGTVVASPDYLMEAQERSGNNNWQDQPVHVCNWWGGYKNSGTAPGALAFPRYIRGNNTVVFKLTNLTATAARVDVALIGTRVTYLNRGVTRESLFGVPF